MKKRAFFAVLLVVFGLSCLATLSPVAAQEAGPKKFTVSELEFSRPDSWQSVRPRSSMRKAQMKVPGPGHFPVRV